MKPLLRELHLDRVGGLSGAELRLSDPVVRRMEKLTGIDAERLRAMTLALCRQRATASATGLV